MHDAERDGRVLGRVVTLLLAFAALAEQAGRRSFPVRWFVLAILRHAEAVARDFIIETTGTTLPCAEVPLGTAGGPADAACLAGRLRALAALLRACLPPEISIGSQVRSVFAPRRLAGHPPATSFRSPTRPAPDTS